MEQVSYTEPHPEWTEIVILWSEILYGPKYPIKQILEWIDAAPGGRYHLHGHDSTEGFAFRFEDPRDATYFKLKWL